jgi:hypothetical protein
MLVTVLTTALILSLTGMAVVEFGFYGRSTAQDAVHAINNRYTVESHVNKALWRVNTFDDSLVSYSDGPVTVTYDTTTMRLLVGVSQYDKTQAVMADLVEDMHFNHAIATNDSLLLYGHTLGQEPSHSSKGEFRFLPTLDQQYFLDSAVAVHDEDYYWYTDADFSQEGIHVFTGESPYLYNVTLHNSSLLFTSQWVTFWGENDIRAAKDSTNQLPAVILTHPDIVFNIQGEFWKQDRIEGAIYCAGKVVLRKGTLSGPIVSRKAAVFRDMNFTDDQNPEYYIWHTGFGHYASYDWPKVITNWADVYIQ